MGFTDRQIVYTDHTLELDRCSMLWVSGNYLLGVVADFNISFEGRDPVEVGQCFGSDDLLREQGKKLSIYISECRSCKRRKFADSTCERLSLPASKRNQKSSSL